MKKIILGLSVLLSITSLGWADNPPMAESRVMDQLTFTGVVRSVSMADKAKGTTSEIVVAHAGKPINILVTSTTTLWDAEAHAIMLDKIVPRNKVNVVYTTTDEGVNVGKLVKIIK